MYTITFSLNPAADAPLYEQLYAYFVAEIRAGRLRPGEKLPSKRALCAHLGISRSTVETAYALLVSEGYLYARPKSGYYVADFVALEGVGGLTAHSAPAETEQTKAPPEFDFSTGAVDVSRFPYSSWAKLNKEVVYSSPELLQRGDGQGDAALRRALAAFLGEYRGVQCTPEQIVVGAGMEYLADLLLRLFPADTVFGMEDPGYAALRQSARTTGRTLRFLPLDESGLSMEGLTGSGASVAYVTPSHQFPMGITMPAGRRSQLLHWAAAAPDRYIIEDDYDSEFRYAMRPIPAMQGMDSAGRVIYLGTFSRSLAPSIRVAYMVLPPALLARYHALFGHARSTVSRYEQAVLSRFLAEGFYMRYLRRVGNLYRQRRARLLSALETVPGVSISGSGGGIHFLLTNPHFSEPELCQRALSAGVALRGLSAYCIRCAPRPSTLVIGYGGLCDEKIPEAAARLSKAWR
ncbi:MAG: PLP-dependent aminotransferase family protein [Oscillospiraceae bacterium]|nr:PLP-dependent aminotransferase family protein [Oscillospiraceae bacterium]MCD8256749.1 PLP-dependent aminotransferase family protein [Oscillospiraceae bacterium]